jgi:hypothetical protein
MDFSIEKLLFAKIGKYILLFQVVLKPAKTATP